MSAAIADRFAFQRQAVQETLTALGDASIAEQEHLLIVNVGANDDPANLKYEAPDRVINCDLFAHDQVLDRPNQVDQIFDCARERWPFADGQAALVILGDILEHLTPEEIGYALREARRVARRLCVTVPEDHRPEVSDERADQFPRGAVHRTTVTRALLEPLLDWAGWTVTDWREVCYDDGRHWGQQTGGHFILAR